MSNTKTRLTYADYLEMSDDERYELLNGELVLSPSPKEIHLYTSSMLHLKIGTHARKCNLGKVYFSPFDVVLSDTDVVQPDSYSSQMNAPDMITPDNVRGAPDLVVEILSPTTADRDRTIKLDLYATHGVKGYWMVDPDSRTVIVLLRDESRFEVSGIYGEGQTLSSPTLKGFSVALGEIFQEDE